MLTSRGWWLLTLTLIVSAVGGVMAARGNPTLFCSGLAIVLWFACEWSVFLYRAWLVVPHLKISRELADARGPVVTLWSNQAYRVNVTATLPKGRLPIVEFTDRLPAGAEPVGDTGWFAGDLTANAPALWSSQIRCDRPGVVRFEGVRLQMADPQGFFYFETFLRAPLERPVLSGDAPGDLAQRADKRVNLLPPPGMHRHRRPGTGSELLELRDYRPGDPPKRIAWKVSARRDQLITREYESEVPVRCTLVLDASAASRLGASGQTPLARFAAVAASVARAAIANRDLVGLAVCTEATVEYRAPARSAAHLVDLLEQLARAAPLQPEVATDEIGRLLSRAHALATDVYPDLMAPSLNRFPSWLPWLKPVPVYVRRPKKSPVWSWFRSLQRVNSPASRRRYGWRKRVAALLTAIYQLPPGTVGLMLEDDLALATWLQRFLADHHVPYDVPERDARGFDLFGGRESLLLQAGALTRAVGRGRDNELFVLLGDYVRRHDALTDLLKAIRVARARHHQLLVIQPGIAPNEPAQRPHNASADALLDYARSSASYHTWQATRRAFGRLGVPLVAADAGDPARLILHRLERLRAVQGTGR